MWGGWLLAVLGIGLVALAVVFAEHPAVAPIFAIGGIGLILVGVLLPRVEGQFELSGAGAAIKFFLADVRVLTQGLETKAKAQVLDQLVEEIADEGAPPSIRTATRVVGTVVANAQASMAVGHLFAQWLQSNGWTLVAAGISTLSQATEFDVVAQRGKEWLVVEASAGVLGAGFLVSAASLSARTLQLRGNIIADQDAHIRPAVVTSTAPSTMVIDSLRPFGVEIYVQTEHDFEQVV